MVRTFEKVVSYKKIRVRTNTGMNSSKKIRSRRTMEVFYKLMRAKDGYDSDVSGWVKFRRMVLVLENKEFRTESLLVHYL